MGAFRGYLLTKERAIVNNKKHRDRHLWQTSTYITLFSLAKMTEKADVDHVSARDVEALGKRPTIEPLPQSAKTEAGVILNIENSSETSLRLAKDGHVSHSVQERNSASR
jgi:hypothetical protein